MTCVCLVLPNAGTATVTATHATRVVFHKPLLNMICMPTMLTFLTPREPFREAQCRPAHSVSAEIQLDSCDKADASHMNLHFFGLENVSF